VEVNSPFLPSSLILLFVKTQFRIMNREPAYIDGLGNLSLPRGSLACVLNEAELEMESADRCDNDSYGRYESLCEASLEC
jgi:hypothetical protein